MSLTDRTVPTDVALNTDLYELTMAQAFFESGRGQDEAVFNVFFRENPFDGGYAVACGTGQIAELVENFRFDSASVDYLAGLEAPGGGKMFEPAFLEWLAGFTPDVTIHAVREGDVVFPREPLVRVQGNVVACQLIETALLNLVNFQTLVATKAARVVQAAEGHAVSDFGLRRAQGPDGGLAVARASYVGGASSTSNVLAGKIYGIPVFGTHAHSWVMAFPTELEAFRAFAASMPNNCTLLVDTYDVESGIENAITVAKEMEARGERLRAVRLDSGDLAKLAKYARRRFDEEDLPYVGISASNDLDEYTIQSLFAQGAPIDSFGVGTKLATCDPQPSLGGVYKLTAFRKPGESAWTPTMKLSEQAFKRTIPGVQHVLRYRDTDGVPVGDIIVVDDVATGSDGVAVDVLDPDTVHRFDGATAEEVLVCMVRDGKRAAEPESLDVARARCRNALMHLDPAIRRYLNPQFYPVGLEPGLAELRTRLIVEEREEAMAVAKSAAGASAAEGGSAE